MANFIKSKIQQSLSFLLMLVIAFSAFSGVLFVNPSPSYAFKESDVNRALNRDMNLVGADLSRADLSRANLRGARLAAANLIGANLSKADFSKADFSKADFSNADFSNADFSGANLSGADFLNDAYLIDAIADSRTNFPDGFDANGAGVIFRN